MNVAVLMAGGRGERLWPASTPERPKQFLSLLGVEPLLTEAARRVLPLVGETGLYVVADRRYFGQAVECLPYLDESHFIAEPFGRNTLPCLGLAAVHLEKEHPGEDPVMICLPADHYVPDGQALTTSLSQAVALAETGSALVVTLGIEPMWPETGYGYIRTGAAISTNRGVEAYAVDRFVEKPDLPTAKSYLSTGDHLWNGGIFVWKVSVLRRLIQYCQPALHDVLESIKAAVGTSTYDEVLDAQYHRAPSISVDYGIMEPLTFAEARLEPAAAGVMATAVPAAVVPFRAVWDDVGNWAALGRLAPSDPDGNVSVGPFYGVGAQDCITYSTGLPVTLLGVEGLVVVSTDQGILVCPKELAQDVKKVAEKVHAGNVA